jgi:hypothetical protein
MHFSGVYVSTNGVLALAVTRSRRQKVFLETTSASNTLNKLDISGDSGHVCNNRNSSTGFARGATCLLFGNTLSLFHSLQQVVRETAETDKLFQVDANGLAGVDNELDLDNFISHLLPANEAKLNLQVESLADSVVLSTDVLQNISSCDGCSFNNLIPQGTLLNSVKDSMSLTTSIPVIGSNLNLISAQISPTVQLSSVNPIGFGDDLLPTSFKSMQVSVGASLATSCSDSTTLSLEGIGPMITLTDGNKKSSVIKQVYVLNLNLNFFLILIVLQLQGTIQSGECSILLNTTLTEYHVDVSIVFEILTLNNFMSIAC